MRRLVSETRIVSSAKRVKFRFALQESDTEERLLEWLHFRISSTNAIN